MLSQIRVVAAFVAFLVLLGCGGGSGDAVDTSQPLEGRELRRASELEGVWLGVSEGNFIGIEFMADGKALATPLGSVDANGDPQSLLYNYTVLDGGRLALVNTNGVGQQTYVIKIDGDQLEMTGFANTQRLLRLPDGQTLQQGFEQQAKLREAEWEKRYQGVDEFLRNPDVVIVASSPTPDAPPAMALEVAADGSGKAWYDDTAPHLDAVRAQIDAAPNSLTPTVEIGFGQRLRPPTAEQSAGGSITFTASGDMANPTWLSQVNYGGRTFELTLRRDAGRHREIVGRFDAEMARADALTKPITELLKDVAFLDAVLSTETPANPSGHREHIVLTRNPNTGAYSGSSVSTLVDRGAQTQFPAVSAEVQVINDLPMLIITTPVRQYQLTASAGKFSGAWFPYARDPGYAAEVTVTRATDAATLQRENDAQKQAWLALNDSVSFLGFLDQFPTAGWGQLSLTVLTLSPQPDGNFKATALYPVLGGTALMTGSFIETLDGPLLQLDFADFLVNGQSGGGVLGTQLRVQNWALEMTEAAPGKRVLRGSGKNVRGAIEFVEITTAWRADQKRAITQALTAGANFSLLRPLDEAAVIRLQLDPATNQISGSVVTDGTRWRGLSGLPWVGELTEIDGFPVIVVTLRTDPNGRNPMDSRSTLFGIQRPEGLLLTGYGINNRNGYRDQSELLATDN